MTSVYVCVVTRDSVRDDVLHAVSESCRYATEQGIQCEMARAISPYGVVQARNYGVANFLKTNHSHLLFVDDDVTIPPNAVAELSGMGSDVAGGCVPSYRIPASGSPFFYVQVQKPFADWYREWPVGIVEAEAVGGGCMCIARHVLEATAFPWFAWPQAWHKGEIVSTSDDTDFCGRAKMAGFAVQANGAVRCKHHKTIDVGALIPGPRA